jgi:hypothetical protein
VFPRAGYGDPFFAHDFIFQYLERNYSRFPDIGKAGGIYFGGLAGGGRAAYKQTEFNHGGFMRINGFVLAVSALLVAGVFAQEAPDAEETIKKLKKHLSLGSVVKTDFRDAQNMKNERVKATTSQDEDDPFLGTMRFTVEVTDNAGEVRWGQVSKAQSKHPPEYEGKDEWTFEFAHGELDKPKITAYALEYGWETNKVFTSVVQKLDKVESADEITDRNKANKKLGKITVKGKSLRQAASE